MATASGTRKRCQAPTENTYGPPCSSPATSTTALPCRSISSSSQSWSCSCSSSSGRRCEPMASAANSLFPEFRDDPADRLEVGILMKDRQLMPHRRGDHEVVGDRKSLMCAVCRQSLPDSSYGGPGIVRHRYPGIEA